MIFFTSDQHFGHTNVIKYCNRPFGNVEEMNEELVRRHNAIVSPSDTVYHLGDFSLAKRMVPLYLPRLNGTHHLIMGNHDACHEACAKKTSRQLAMIEEYKAAGFTSVSLVQSMEIAGQQVWLHHMPYSGDHEVERYTEYRLEDTGLWLLHGHVHDSWKIKDKQINVGVDVWGFAPVPLSYIESLILTGAKE